MKLLITGGAGLIGQAIAKHHLSQGDIVYIYDNKSNPYNDYSNIIGIDCYSRDFEELLLTEKFDIISHQAASVGVGESMYNIQKYITNNIQFTAELLQAIINTKMFPKHLILASSMGPYGYGNNIKGKEIKETDLRIPQSIYGISKMTQEEMFRVFSETYNVKTIALRYFSVYGTKANPNNPFTGVLSIIANKIINSKIVELNEDGEQTRDLISADDCANAHFQASRFQGDSTTNFYAFNLGTGKAVSLKYVAEKMIYLLDPTKELKFNGQYRKGDIKHSCAATQVTYLNLGFKANTTIDYAITEYCSYIHDNWELFKTKDTCQEEQDKLSKLNLLK
jgi:nucleoside-diphosphate-sugar epimerase